MFTIPEDALGEPRWFYDLLVAQAPEFAVLNIHKPSVAFILRHEPKFKAGRQVLGSVHAPAVQGDLAPLFEWFLERTFGELPTYLFVLDAEYWASAGTRLREILMFHEMKHCDQARDKYGEPRFHRETGDPIWRIVGHDVEEFSAVVARYGAYSKEIEEFLAAARLGESLVETQPMIAAGALQ